MGWNTIMCRIILIQISKHKLLVFVIVMLDLIVTFIFLHNYTRTHFIDRSKKYLSTRLWQQDAHSEANSEQGILDIHHENKISNILGHHHGDSKLTTVAVGLALTSFGVQNITAENIDSKIPFLKTLLPSFCKTSTQGYSYHFYVAFDANDALFTDEITSSWFSGAFYRLRQTHCSYVSELQLHLIECDHRKKPAWAQNDAMMEAFLDNVQYYYRVNDDTVMKSPGWTELYIATLAEYTPANVGVVGPKHEGGNHDILTYDFVHRKHIEIFGFYYPRVFTDWFADNWISEVYSQNRTAKLPQVKVVHTQTLGKRYLTNFNATNNLKQQIQDDRKTLDIYVERSNNFQMVANKQYGISVTFTSFHPDQIYGLLRNVNLIKLYLPQWTVHVFIRDNGLFSTDGRLHQKLKSINVTIHLVKGLAEVPDQMLGYLIADEKQVERFLFRDVLGRINEREVSAVDAWLKSEEHGLHCMRDHPLHQHLALVPGLWGASHNALIQALGPSMRNTLQEYFMDRRENRSELQSMKNRTNSLLTEEMFLQKVIWPKMKNNALCHDSVFCDIWPNSVGFPSNRQSSQSVGMKYKAFEVLEMTSNSSVDSINSNSENCSRQSFHLAVRI